MSHRLYSYQESVDWTLIAEDRKLSPAERIAQAEKLSAWARSVAGAAQGRGPRD